MVTYYGTGSVWDKENNRRLCKFENGKLNTEDGRTIAILESLGFECEGESNVIVIDETDIIEDELTELKLHCKEQGYKGYGNFKDVEKIKEFIAKKEGL